MEHRIKPIERPKKLLAKIGFWFIKRELGKVTSVAKVIYSRFPKVMLLVKKMLDIEKKHSLSPQFQIIIQKYVAYLNGCTFCMDVSDYKAQDLDVPRKKMTELSTIKTSQNFSLSEKAALQYVEELTNNVSVDDETFLNLKQQWTDNEIIEITYCASVENFLNRLVKPLGIGDDNLCQRKESGQ
ncbi:MAG: hypothetical protein RLO81_19660 [Fulvivirga sp.]|uniref:carboxymuconolactone decarboxylase family protein n=1 Tax=Fulvivirga sp. TaxID=1931237 RepID=UPI0032EF3A03